MNYHFSDRIYSRCLIMCSDDDQPMVMNLFVGFNWQSELAVSVEFHDSEQPDYDCSTMVVVDPRDARVMARRHGLKYSGLPLFIAECMAPWRELVNPSFNQVLDCFKEITESLLDERCRFRIKRISGKDGHVCC